MMCQEWRTKEFRNRFGIIRLKDEIKLHAATPPKGME